MNTTKALENVKNLRKEKEAGKRISIREVHKQVGIFDWFKNELSLTDLKNMESFLKNALKMGYTGHVDFKVGCAGTANGMWAHKKESTTGFSPDGPFIYRSFTPSYTEWALKFEDNTVHRFNSLADLKKATR